jgi:hypothetical protein
MDSMITSDAPVPTSMEPWQPTYRDNQPVYPNYTNQVSYICGAPVFNSVKLYKAGRINQVLNLVLMGILEEQVYQKRGGNLDVGYTT